MLSTIAVGVDGSATSARALDWAWNASARVQHIISTTQDRLTRAGVRCTALADEGDPGDVLVRLAEEGAADILVVANKGMQRRVLGSVPNTVSHKAQCSVLVVKTT